jgi:hypothetical protein
MVDDVYRKHAAKPCSDSMIDPSLKRNNTESIGFFLKSGVYGGIMLPRQSFIPAGSMQTATAMMPPSLAPGILTKGLPAGMVFT